jgi:hypothetical protein
MARAEGHFSSATVTNHQLCSEKLRNGLYAGRPAAASLLHERRTFEELLRALFAPGPRVSAPHGFIRPAIVPAEPATL